MRGVGVGEEEHPSPGQAGEKEHPSPGRKGERDDMCKGEWGTHVVGSGRALFYETRWVILGGMTRVFESFGIGVMVVASFRSNKLSESCETNGLSK